MYLIFIFYVYGSSLHRGLLWQDDEDDGKKKNDMSFPRLGVSAIDRWKKYSKKWIPHLDISWHIWLVEKYNSMQMVYFWHIWCIFGNSHLDIGVNTKNTPDVNTPKIFPLVKNTPNIFLVPEYTIFNIPFGSLPLWSHGRVWWFDMIWWSPMRCQPNWFSRRQRNFSCWAV